MLFIFISFLTGMIIVINMMLNGRLAQREGMVNGVIINYMMAVLSSLLLCAVMMNTIPTFAAIRNTPPVYYLGGFIGVLTTYLFNVIVPKVPAVYVVILRFTGQMLTGAIIDYLFLHIFSKGKVIGGLLFLTGLIWNAGVDKKYEKK